MILTRFNNARIDNGKYVVDVEFISDRSEILAGMNVRFWYDGNDFQKSVKFRNFEAGYAPLSPTSLSGVTAVKTLPKSFNWFNFSGDNIYVNGAIDLKDRSNPIVLDSSWKKLFEVELTPINVSCPSLVWDLEENTANGGYLPGSEGVVMVALKDGKSVSVKEVVFQYNWEYTSPTAPYGQKNCS